LLGLELIVRLNFGVFARCTFHLNLGVHRLNFGVRVRVNCTPEPRCTCTPKPRC